MTILVRLMNLIYTYRKQMTQSMKHGEGA